MNNLYYFPADWDNTIYEEEKAIRQIMQRFETAANERKPKETADLVAQNAIIVNVAGIRFDGKEEFYLFIQKAMEGALSNLVRKNEITDIRFIRHDVAVVSATQVAATKEGTFLKEHGKGSVTSVLVKEQGKWVITMAQNTMIGQWE